MKIFEKEQEELTQLYAHRDDFDRLVELEKLMILAFLYQRDAVKIGMREQPEPVSMDKIVELLERKNLGHHQNRYSDIEYRGSWTWDEAPAVKYVAEYHGFEDPFMFAMKELVDHDLVSEIRGAVDDYDLVFAINQNGIDFIRARLKPDEILRLEHPDTRFKQLVPETTFIVKKKRFGRDKIVGKLSSDSDFDFYETELLLLKKTFSYPEFDFYLVNDDKKYHENLREIWHDAVRRLTNVPEGENIATAFSSLRKRISRNPMLLFALKSLLLEGLEQKGYVNAEFPLTD